MKGRILKINKIMSLCVGIQAPVVERQGRFPRTNQGSDALIRHDQGGSCLKSKLAYIRGRRSQPEKDNYTLHFPH